MSTKIQEVKLDITSGDEEQIGEIEVPINHVYTILEVQLFPGPDGEIEGYYDNERQDFVTTETARDDDALPYYKNDALGAGQKYIFIGRNLHGQTQTLSANVVFEDKKIG